jgi:hypothetical protein
MPILFFSSSSFSSQCWPTHGQAKPQPIFWLHKLLVGQTWAQTEHIHGLVLLEVGYPLPTKAFIVFILDFVEDARCGNQ